LTETRKCSSVGTSDFGFGLSGFGFGLSGFGVSGLGLSGFGSWEVTVSGGGRSTRGSAGGAFARCGGFDSGTSKGRTVRPGLSSSGGGPC
jgi:hypothetical protein